MGHTKRAQSRELTRFGCRRYVRIVETYRVCQAGEKLRELVSEF